MRIFEGVGEVLKTFGVTRVFGLVGSGNFGMVHHMTEGCGIAFHASRHEAAAVGMADGYSRVTGDLGVCTVHQGPGVTNTLTALTEAVKAGSPVLLLAADTPTGSLHLNLDVDQDAVAGSAGAMVERVSGARTAAEDVARAARRAVVERRPVVLSIPIDIQGEDCDYREPEAPVRESLSSVRPSAEDLGRLADLVGSSERPVIIAGKGALLSAARRDLEALGDHIGAIFATSMMAKGFFAGSDFDVGVSGGFASPLAANLIPRADLVLSFGASLNSWTTRHGRLISPFARVVHVDVDPSAIGRMQHTDVGVVGDAAATSAALLEELALRGAPTRGFRSEDIAQEIRDFDWRNEFAPEDTPGTVDPRSLMIALDEVLPEERTVTVDCGHFAGFAARHLSVPDARCFVFAEAFQAVGLGMGAGMGAAVGRPEHLAVVVVGDGGLLMSLGELDAAAHLGVPLLVVVANDEGYGAEVHHFRALGMPTGLARFGGSDFAAIAAAVGAGGITVRAVGDLRQLEGWLSKPEGVMVADCKVNPDVEGDYLREAFVSEAKR